MKRASGTESRSANGQDQRRLLALARLASPTVFLFAVLFSRTTPAAPNPVHD
jgi:hypothetical protein